MSCPTKSDSVILPHSLSVVHVTTCNRSGWCAPTPRTWWVPQEVDAQMELGDCRGETPMKEKGRKQVWAGGAIIMWLEKSLCPSGAPEQRPPTGASRVGRNSSALGPPPCSLIVQGLPREGHDFSLTAEEDLGDASDRRLSTSRVPPSQAASPFLKGDLSGLSPCLLSQASRHLLLELGSFPVANPCPLEQILVDDRCSNNIAETCVCVCWGRARQRTTVPTIFRPAMLPRF